MLSFGKKKKAFKKIISAFLKIIQISVEAAKVLNGVYHACLLLGSDVDALEEFLMYEICKWAIKLFDMVYKPFILQTHIHFQLLVFDVYTKPIMSVLTSDCI